MLTCRAGPPPGAPPPPGPPPGTHVAVARTERIPFGPDCPGTRTRTTVRRGIGANSNTILGVGRKKDQARRAVVVVENKPTQEEEEECGLNPRAEDAISSKMVQTAHGPRRSVKRTLLRKGEALIDEDRTHEPMTDVKSIQVLQGPAQAEQCAPHTGEPTEHCAQHIREPRAQDTKSTRWYRPLTAVTNEHGGDRGTGATLEESVQLVRSALAHYHRSAICTGTLGVHRSTGPVSNPYNRVYYKPPAYCGRHIAPALTAWLEAYVYTYIYIYIYYYGLRPPCA